MYVRHSSSSGTPALKVILPILTVLAITLLSGCNGQTAQLRLQGDAEAYIRQHIADLSPSSAEVGGTFQVSEIEWVDDDTALVTYDDGHIEIRGHTDVREVNGRIVATTIVRDDDGADDGDNNSSVMMVSSAIGSLSSSARSVSASVQASASMSTSVSVSTNASASISTSVSTNASVSTSVSTNTSTSVRTGAGLGEFCGGIAALPCSAGYTCKLDGTYPDAGGTCVQS
jgi:hypothetical protein